MKEKLLIFIMIIVTFSVIGFYAKKTLLPQKQNETLIFTSPTKSAIVDEIILSGEIDADRSIEIISPKIRGYYKLMVEKRIDEGVVVKKGDSVVEFDTSELEKDLSELQDQLMVSKVAEQKRIIDNEITINEIKTVIAVQMLNVKKAKLKIVEDDSVSKKGIARQKINYQQAKIYLKKYEEKLAHQLMKDKKEIEIFRLQRNKLLNKIENINTGLERYSLKSPASGLIIHPRVYLSGQRGKIKEGTTVSDGITVIKIPDLTSLVAVVYIDEIDVLKIKENQPVTLFLDIAPDKPIAGKIQSISVLPSTRKERENLKTTNPEYLIKEFTVKVSFDKISQAIMPGISVRIKIDINMKEDVLTLPISALKHENDAYFVLKGNGKNHLVWTKVKPGVFGFSRVEILEGISADDEVLLNFPLENSSKLEDNKG